MTKLYVLTNSGRDTSGADTYGAMEEDEVLATFNGLYTTINELLDGGFIQEV